MKKYLFLALATACASPPPPACPACYSIDEAAPYEPPQRVIILCDNPDADAPAVDDAGDLIPF